MTTMKCKTLIQFNKLFSKKKSNVQISVMLKKYSALNLTIYIEN